MAPENPYRPAKPTKPQNIGGYKKKSSVGWCILWFFIGMLIPIGVLGIVAGVVPVGTLLDMAGLQGYVSEKVSAQSLIGLVNYVPEMTIGDIPGLQSVVEDALSNAGYSSWVTIDWQALSNTKLTSASLSTDIGNALKITLSIKTLEAQHYVTLDDGLKDIPCFNDQGLWVKVTEEVDPSASDFAPALYYYDSTENDGNANNSNYLRAFNDDKTYVDGVTAATPLYLVNLYEASLTDVLPVIVTRLKLESASEVIAAISDTIPDDSLIAQIVGDRSIGELSQINANDIQLSALIEATEENQQMRDVISSWMGKAWEEVTLADLTSGSQPITNIKLSILIDRDDPSTNSQLIKVIESMIWDTDWEDITIGQLMSSEYSTEDIKLSIFLPEGEEGTNQQFINVIKGMINDKEYEDVTLGDLTSDKYSFQDVSISAIMPEEDVDPSIVTMLEGVTGSSWENITISDLEKADSDNLKLSEILDDPGNPILDVLVDLLGGGIMAEDITIGHLNSIQNFDGLLLSSVLDVYDEQGNINPIYTILLDVCPDAESVEDISVGDLGNITDFNGLRLISVLDEGNPIFDVLVDLVGNGATADTITVGDLNGIQDFTKLHLTVLIEDQKVVDPVTGEETSSDLYQILMDITGCTASEQITVGHLEKLTSDDFANIKLSRVLPIEDNQTLYNILIEATVDPITGASKTAENITVGDLNGFDIDNVKMTTVLPYRENDVIDPETGEVLETKNTALYSILCDMTGKTREELTIADLSNANPADIKIFDAIDPNSEDVTNSSFLRALKQYSPDVTVGNIGQALNDLPLSDVYGGICWTQTRADAASGDVYTLQEVYVTNPTTGVQSLANQYTYTYGTSEVDLEGNQWFISNTAGCWLIFCNEIVYDTSTEAANPAGYTPVGLPYTVTEDPDFTLAQMEKSSSTTAYKITHTTIHTLILTKLMDEGTPAYENKVRRMTIQDMIDFVTQYSIYIPA